MTATKARLGSAVRLTVAATLLSGVMQGSIVVVMARFVGPLEYGAYALCIAVLSLTTNFVSGSIERSMIVAGEVEFKGAMFATGVLVLATSIVAVVVSGFITQIGVVKIRLDLLVVLLLGAVISGLSLAPRVYLRRKLEYRWIVIAELAGLALGTGAVAMVMALMGYGAFALVGGALAQNIVALAILMIGGAGGASLSASLPTLKRTFHGALNVSKLSTLEVAHSQIPNVFLSALGPTALGLFNRSQTIVQLPVQLLTASMTRVMISGITSVTDQRERFIRGSRMLVMSTSAIIGPVNFGIAASHETFTDVMLGKTWASASPLVPLMALTSWAIMTSTVTGVISEAVRRFGWKAAVQGVSSICLILSLMVSVKYGLLHASLGIAIAALFALAMNIVLASSVLGIAWWRFCSWLLPGITAGLISGAFCLTVGWVLRHEPSVYVLLLQIGGSAALTAGYGLMWQRNLLLAVTAMVLPAAWNASLVRWLARIPAKRSRERARND